MFYSLEITDFHLFASPQYISSFEVLAYKLRKKRTLNNLKDYLLTNGSSLDGDKIQKHLFPDDDVDIFLSHSSIDTDEVIKLAISLENKGLKVFIDSYVWGNAFDLLKSIDDEYCINPHNGMYDYQKRNYSTSHIYMMLNTALHKVIDRSEIFLFLGTPNSISIKDGIKNQESLKSPWILSELAFIQHVRRKTSLKVLGSLTESLEKNEAAMDSLQVRYNKPKLDYEINSYTLEKFLKETYCSGRKQFLRIFQNYVRKHSIHTID